MSKEENIYDNADLPNNEEELTSTEPETKPETKPMAAPELEPGPDGEIISPVTEESGVEEAATGEAMGEQGEQIRLHEVEQLQLRPQTKPKKQTMSTSIMKIQKINQNLQSLQKQFKLGKRQSEIFNQIRSQVNQIQKQISQVQKSIQRR